MSTAVRHDNGFIYCATGERFLNEAIGAAEAFKRVDADARIAVFTDDPDRAGECAAFDEICPIETPNRSYKDKITAMKGSPFRRTVFLDTDTRVLAPVNDLFDMLERFPFLIAHAPRHRHRLKDGTLDTVLPEAFPQLNSGVVGFTDDAEVAAMLDDWVERYDAGDALFTGDQGALSHALWFSRLPFYVLPPEYNFRPHQIACKSALTRIKIVHSRWLIDQGEEIFNALLAHLDKFDQHVSWVPHNGVVSYLPLQWRGIVPKKLTNVVIAEPTDNA